MEEEDTESRCSIPVDLSPTVSRKQKLKVNIYNEVLVRLKYSDDVPEAQFPGFEDQLWAHFNRLPTRYALDVNVERAQDVLMHKRLLHMAHDPATRPAVQVRLVQVHSSAGSSSLRKADAQSSSYATKQSHPPPAFGLSQDLELALETKKLHVQHGKASQLFTRPMHEITISTMDRPKLLSELTSLLSDVGLNIQEAHAFSTTDGYSLDVFVVDGWEFEETERLRQILEKQISWSEKNRCLDYNVISPVPEQMTGMTRINDDVSTPDEGKDIWEIDPSLLRYKKKIASGSNGDLYQGIFCGQDVAIKVLGNNLSNDRLNETMREFSQEVYIMRKVRHKNVVQFIGACTKPPNFCIVTEFLSGGSMYDFLHKQMGSFSLQSLLRVAIDISRGMKYLHQNNIIHRDLKAANLLVDENGVVKVADFGIARVQAQSGVMTAETGTYRWMAPEVIEHKPYDHKADVFSFGVVLWELLTGKLPYKNLTPVQAALGVLKEGLRPSIPKDTNPMLVELMERCWQKDASLRPEFSEIVNMLRQMARMVADERDDRRKGKSAKVVPALRQGNAQ